MWELGSNRIITSAMVIKVTRHHNTKQDTNETQRLLSQCKILEVNSQKYYQNRN